VLRSTSAHGELADPGAARGSGGVPKAGATSSQEGSEVDEQLGDLASKSLEELLNIPVVTATKTERKLSEAPATVSVVTREDITRWGYTSVAEVLQHTLGFYVVDDHVLPNAGVRGVAGGLFGESSAIKVMIDGHSVAFRSTGGNWLGPELVPLTAVERIEIILGPSSALYGADAFLGTVNIITRRGEQLSGADIRIGMELSAGRDPGRDVDVAAGTRNGPVEASIATRLHADDRSGLAIPSTSPSPRIPRYLGSNPQSTGATGTSSVALSRVTYHFDDRRSLSLVGYYSAFDRGSEFSPWTQMPYGVDSNGQLHQTRVSLRQLSVGLVHESSFGSGSGITLQGYYFSGGPASDDRIDVGSQVFEIRRQFGFRGVEGLLEGRTILPIQLALVGGAELSVDQETMPSSSEILLVGGNRYRVGDEIQMGSAAGERTDISNIGLYSQASWNALAPYVSVTGGARYDYHSIYGGQVSGRVGVVSNPTRPLHLKLLYGSAFKAPSPLLLYGVPFSIGDIVGNPNLKPQRVDTVEVQATLEPFKDLLFSTGLAYSRLLNQAEFVQQGFNSIARNLGALEALSWESSVRASYQKWILGYTTFELPVVTRSLGQTGYAADLVGQGNVIYPSHILRVGISGRVPRLPFKVTFEVVQVGSRRASDMNILDNAGSYSLSPYALLDASLATVGLELLRHRETVILLKGRNLLSDPTPDPGFAGVDYPRLPLSVMLQLRQEL